MSPNPKNESIPEQVKWIAIVWLILGTVSATQTVLGTKAAGFHNHWAALFLTTMAGWIVLAVPAPGILRMIRRFPLGRGRWRGLAFHVVAAVGLGVAYAAWTAALESAFDPFPDPRSFRSSFITAMYSRFHIGIIIYAVIVVASAAIDSIRSLAQRDAEAARLESELAKTQLEALRRRLEPRFVFNTLNSIGTLLGEKRNDDAVAMLAGLSDLLRRLLHDGGSQLVPLAEEVSFLQSYIEILAMRPGGRVIVTLDVPREIYGVLVPPLILQPLIENAIENRSDGSEIRLTVRESGDDITIRLSTNGPASFHSLKAVYGSHYDLHMSPQGEAVLTVPQRTAA